jgi:hypothetical protein
VKHLKRLFTLVLFLLAMLVTASTTYATSSPNVTYLIEGQYVYVEINGTTNLNDPAVTWDTDYQIDFRDSGIAQTPSKFYIEYMVGGTTTVEDFVISGPGESYGWLNLWFDGNYMAHVDFDTDDGAFFGSSPIDQLYQEDEVVVYFELPFEDASPVLTGETAFVTNVDLPLTEASIRSNIYAYDDTDGDITHLITKTSDTYTPNMNTVGTWQIVYSVEDSAGNVATLTVHVLVRDVTAPTWNVAKAEVSVSYTATFDIEAYKSQLGASDNYDTSGSLTITVESNNYTANKTVVGTYYVVYKIKDTAGNQTLAEVEVNVVDTVAPTISGPSTIVKPNNTTLTVSEIKSQLTSNDAVAGNLTSSIVVTEDNYTGKGHLVGSYTITFSVTDPSGNTATHVVTVTVEDNIPPIFYIKDNYFITVDQSVSLSLTQIIEILEITGQLETSGSGGIELTTLVNEYVGNENIPGIYAVSLKAVSVSGNESIHNVAIEVLESDTEDPIVIDEDASWYQPVVDFATEIWGWVKDNVLLSIGIGIGLIGLILIIVATTSSNKRHGHYRRY